MTSDQLFQLANPLAAVGWAALLAYPLAPRQITVVAGVAIPVILSLGYAAVILVHWSAAPGGFDSLGNVQALFTAPWIALAGWVHYLAFDLAVGAWEARDARTRSIPHLLVIPCLALTFLFGPIGLLLYLGLRTANTIRERAAA